MELLDENDASKIANSITADLVFGQCVTCYLATLCFGIVQGIRHGFGESDYSFLILASLFCWICLGLYWTGHQKRAKGFPKEAWMSLVTPFVWIVYLYIGYLTLYRGLWSFTYLRNGFETMAVLEPIFFTLIGRRFFRGLEALTGTCGHINLLLKAKNSSRSGNDL